MHIKSLLEKKVLLNENGVPDWMVGCFKRRSITFANAKTDNKTHVFWLQGRNITIDCRLPIDTEIVKKSSWEECRSEELRQLANYEGWSANCQWNTEMNQLSWSDGASFQIHNRWPEPAQLTRVGDCMIELSPKLSYVEDWRILNRLTGPLISLSLLDEVNTTTGNVRHKGGALIIVGEWAGLVLGRPTPLELTRNHHQLRDEVSLSSEPLFLDQIFNFETSIAKGNINEGFSICYSTQFRRMYKLLFDLNNFEFDPVTKEVTQYFNEGNDTIKRRFIIDAIEPEFKFSKNTQWHPESKAWFNVEEETLARYL